MAKKAKPIAVEAIIDAPLEEVWQYWNDPKHVTKWNFASNDWACPSGENDLRVGGKFRYTMAAKDKSVSFDFGGKYIKVEKNKLIEYRMEEGRQVKVVFEKTPKGVKVIETFDPENENPIEMQRDGWQSILNNFRRYVVNRKP